MNLIEKGIEKGLISFDNERKFITYIYQNKKRNYNNPEEKVQAETFLTLVLIYNYPVEQIKQFESITMGSSKKESDMVVFEDAKCTKPLIIVECKHSEISEQEFIQAIEQAASYAYAIAGTIKYVWLTSGIKNQYILIDKDSEVKQEIANIPTNGVKEIQAFKYAKGGRKKDEEAGENPIKKQFFDLETITEDELTRRFKQAHNALWAGGQLNPSEAFDELDKLIFCKIWDEKKAREIGKPYDFQIINEKIPTKATKEEREKIELKVAQNLYDRIIRLYQEGKNKDPEVFKDNIRLDQQRVKTVVNYLEGINLNETDLDSKGKAFETFLGSYFRGNFGQFFTPRPIVKFIVGALPISANNKVLDTSCGSGGFLLYALDKARKEANKYFPEWETNPKEYNKHYNYWHDFAEKNLFGIEINEQIARTAKMNMIIHDDGQTNVIASDGLLTAKTIIENTENKGFAYDSFDFIVTNPPFGSIVKQTEKAYLKYYQLSNKDVDWLDSKNSAVQKRKNQSTEVLFIEQCYNFLKENGYLAVVLPDGILTNSSLQYVRDNIEKWFRIVAVVSLPQTAFSHTGAGVKSSVLFLRKWNKQKTEEIESLKTSLQIEIKDDKDFFKKIKEIEKIKKSIIKNHTDFKNNTGKTEKKIIEKTADFKAWKKEITDKYNEKISDFKEKLNELYQEKKQSKFLDYDIYMAIAEDIGYDATGKATANNELNTIEKEVFRFIKAIENGTEALFEIQKDKKKNQFLIKFSKIENRLDPNPYHEERLSILNKIKKLKNVKRLKEITKYNNDIVDVINKEDIYIGLENIKSNTCEYISKTEKKSISSAKRFKKDNILFSKLRPYLNKVYLAEFEGLCSTEFYVFDAKNIIPKYLTIFLSSNIVVSQTKHLMTGNTLPRLQTSDVENIFIPILDKNFQKRIVKIYETAHQIKAIKEAKAKKLLDSIDAYLLKELGIVLPEKDNSFEKRRFKTNFSNITGGRFDSIYHSLYNQKIYSNILNSKYLIEQIKNQAIFQSGGAFSSDDYVQKSDCYLITIKNISKNKININKVTYLPNQFYNDFPVFHIKENDLVIAMTGATIGKVGIFKEKINALLNQRNGIIKSTKLNTFYLMNLLNTSIYQDLILKNSVGGAQANISESEIMKIFIPVPPLSKQNEIATYISSLRHEAEQLQTEAKEILETTKQEIESMILG